MLCFSPSEKSSLPSLAIECFLSQHQSIRRSTSSGFLHFIVSSKLTPSFCSAVSFSSRDINFSLPWGTNPEFVFAVELRPPFPPLLTRGWSASIIPIPLSLCFVSTRPMAAGWELPAPALLRSGNNVLPVAEGRPPTTPDLLSTPSARDPFSTVFV